MWLLILALPFWCQPMGPHDPFLLHFWSRSPFSPLPPHHPDAVTHGLFHILQPHLPLVASPKAGCLRHDSFLPLLLDIQTGGQRAWTEIAAWGWGEQRGLSDKQPERHWGWWSACCYCAQWLYTRRLDYLCRAWSDKKYCLLCTSE